jgi:ketosteroid isomerase-like protein
MTRDEETVRAGLAALNRRDVDGMLATLDPGCEMFPLRAVLDGTVYRGHAGLRKWLEDMLEDWDDFRIESIETRSGSDDRLLVLARFHARGRASGVVVDQPAAWVCRLVDGKVVEVRFFEDAEAAQAAAMVEGDPQETRSSSARSAGR